MKTTKKTSIQSTFPIQEKFVEQLDEVMFMPTRKAHKSLFGRISLDDSVNSRPCDCTSCGSCRCTPCK